MDDLPQIHHLPLIGLNDFPKFVEIFAQDDGFPATFDAWEIHLNAREEEVLGAGHVPIFTSVNPANFRQFVDSSTASATFEMLVSYVVLLGSAVSKTD